MVHPMLLTGFDMVVFFTNLCLMEFQVRSLVLFLLFSVIRRLRRLYTESFYENIQLVLEFLIAPLLVLHFSYYTLMTFLILSVILLSILMIVHSALSVIRNWLLTWIWSTRHCRLGQEVACLFQRWKSSTCFASQLISVSNGTGAMYVKMDGPVLEE